MKVKDKLKNGQLSLGTWMQIPSPEIAEILTHQSFDWVALDTEHGVFSEEQIIKCIKSIELGNALPFVRVGEKDEKAIKTALEAGARGIIIPMIDSAEQLRECISYCLYPPQGKRGVGFSRANLFGEHFDTSLESHNKSLVIVAQIESVEAVENLDKILLVEGLDAIMVGPFDLSASMGQVGQFENIKFKTTIEQISKKVKESNVRMGIHIVRPNLEDLKKVISNENHFVAYGIDALFISAGIGSLKDIAL